MCLCSKLSLGPQNIGRAALQRLEQVVGGWWLGVSALLDMQCILILRVNFQGVDSSSSSSSSAGAGSIGKSVCQRDCDETSYELEVAI